MRHALHDGQVIVDILRVECDLVSVGVALIDTIAGVLHGQHVHLKRKAVNTRAN